MSKKNFKGDLIIYLRWALVSVAYFVIAVIVINFIDVKSSYILGIFVLLYAMFVVYLQFIKYNSLMPSVMKEVERIAKLQAFQLDKIDISHAVVSTNGMILWGNQKILEVAPKFKVGEYIYNFFPEISKKILANIGEEPVEVLTEFADKKFRAKMNIISVSESKDLNARKVFRENEKIILIFFYDVTDYYNLKQEADNNKIVTGYIYVDNYYEIAENMEDSKASMLIAMVDRKLTRYISYNKGVLKKLEKDKYFFVTTKKDIEDMIEDKFNILEQTKEILSGDNIPLTLSIGVGYEGKSLESNHDLARVAIDMALGRGGDQAVVKRGQETLFFGGKSASITTNARVRARVKATSFREMLDTKDKVLIMGHRNGDFDSFGASIGIYIMAKYIGKDVHIVINSLTNAVEETRHKYLNNENYDKNMFLSGDDALNFADDDTLLVVVDHNTSGISDEPRLYDLGLNTIVFDHHRVSSNSLTNSILSYIDAGASSTCELVTEIMNYFDDRLRMKQLEADTMLSGIMIDTMNFSFQTSAKTFEAASFLKKKGADSDRVRKNLRVDFEFEKVKNEVIANAEIYKNGYAIAVLDSNGRVEESVAKAEIANELINIKGIKASIVLTQENGKYAISARSIDEVNVQVLMERFGGGGHRSAAGAMIVAESFEDAIAKIKQGIDDFEK